MIIGLMWTEIFEVRERFQKSESVPIIGIGTASDSDCGESEVFYRPPFGLPISIKIFPIRSVSKYSGHQGSV